MWMKRENGWGGEGEWLGGRVKVTSWGGHHM